MKPKSMSRPFKVNLLQALRVAALDGLSVRFSFPGGLVELASGKVSKVLYAGREGQEAFTLLMAHGVLEDENFEGELLGQLEPPPDAEDLEAMLLKAYFALEEMRKPKEV